MPQRWASTGVGALCGRTQWGSFGLRGHCGSTQWGSWRHEALCGSTQRGSSGHGRCCGSTQWLRWLDEAIAYARNGRGAGVRGGAYCRNGGLLGVESGARTCAAGIPMNRDTPPSHAGAFLRFTREAHRQNHTRPLPSAALTRRCRASRFIGTCHRTRSSPATAPLSGGRVFSRRSLEW